jgi:hypothetical protein
MEEFLSKILGLGMKNNDNDDNNNNNNNNNNYSNHINKIMLSLVHRYNTVPNDKY